MTDKEDKNKYSIGGFGFVSIILILLGYFVYGGLHGALAIFLIILVTDIMLLLNIIPVAGLILHVVFTLMFVLPFLYDLCGISPTWLVWVVIGINFVFAIILNFIFSFMGLAFILARDI